MDDNALVDEHLRDHLTDGRYHDRCVYCLVRRSEGGTGVSDGQLIAYEMRRQEAYAAAAKRWESRRNPVSVPGQTDTGGSDG